MSTVSKKLIDLDGLATFKSKYDEKIENEITAIADETIQSLFDNLYATLTYTTTSANQTVQIAYINSYFDSIIVEEDGEELLDGTQSEDNADTVEYTFAEAGTHTVKVRILDATDLSYLFYNCTALTSVSSSLFALAKSNTTFACTFYSCSKLTSIPSGLFDNNTAVTSFSNTFYKCSSLTSIPSGLFDNNTAVTTFYEMFNGCSSLTSLPDGLFANNTLVTSFQYTFIYCSGLSSLPEDLFKYNTAVTTFARTFHGCTSLTSIPSGLFANNTLVTTYYRTFDSDTALTGETPVNSAGLKLWELAGTDGYPDSITGTDCFYNCTGLDDYDEIDDDWK